MSNSDDLVSLTITVSSEHATYILALLNLWNDEPFELNKALVVLPDLIRDIAAQLNMSSELTNSPDDIIQSLKWTRRDTELFDLVLEYTQNELRLTAPPTAETLTRTELGLL